MTEFIIDQDEITKLPLYYNIIWIHQFSTFIQFTKRPFTISEPPLLANIDDTGCFSLKFTL